MQYIISNNIDDVVLSGVDLEVSKLAGVRIVVETSARAVKVDSLMSYSVEIRILGRPDSGGGIADRRCSRRPEFHETGQAAITVVATLHSSD